jgi:hypothetical protein
MFSIYYEHGRRRGYVRLLLTMPFIYGMIIPLVLIDFAISFYQLVCFPAYGIPLVSRKKYVQLVRRGRGLPWHDNVNCLYCSYANGVCAYLRAVLIETEKYWCPIKYQARQGYQPPHPQEAYAEDGDHDALKKAIQNRAPAPRGKV